MSDVTRILSAMDAGEPQAAGQLWPLVYDELRRLAAAHLHREQPGQTLQATALVHEAYLRLVDVDYAQNWTSRQRRNHGGAFQRTFIDLDQGASAEPDELVTQLDAALERFEQVDATACELVKLRYFTGLTLPEASQLLEIPARSADRLWAYAKAWLLRELQSESQIRD